MKNMGHDLLSFAVVLGTLSAACGGSTSSGGPGGASGSGGSTGVGGSPGTGGSGPGACPATPPTAGATCTAPWIAGGGGPFGPSAHCSWGDDPRPECRAKASCVNGVWQLYPLAASCNAPPLPPACLTPPPPGGGVTCSDTQLACWYDDGARCWCSGCQGGTGYPVCQVLDPPQWFCDQPRPGCPIVLPQAGASCSTPGASCSRDCDLIVQCEAGVWQWLRGSCPICAAPDTPIATPSGDRPIASLVAGDLVYSVDHDAIVAVPLLLVGRTPVASHRVMRVVLADGALLEMSPGHPTADGRPFGELTAGALLDPQHTILSAELVPYVHDATYDILSASDTGTYFAAGALVASTLSRPRYSNSSMSEKLTPHAGQTAVPKR